MNLKYVETRKHSFMMWNKKCYEYYLYATAISLSIPGKQGNKPLFRLHEGGFTPVLRQWADKRVYKRLYYWAAAPSQTLLNPYIAHWVYDHSDREPVRFLCHKAERIRVWMTTTWIRRGKRCRPGPAPAVSVCPAAESTFLPRFCSGFMGAPVAWACSIRIPGAAALSDFYKKMVDERAPVCYKNGISKNGLKSKAFEGIWRDDKNTVCLPRQHLTKWSKTQY